MNLLRFFFSNDHAPRAARDQWRPSVVGKNIISPINDYGTCFSCEGSGQRIFDCRACDGKGAFNCRFCPGDGHCQVPAKSCYGCHGTGCIASGKACVRCAGSGIFEQARVVICRCTTNEGKKKLTCRKCDGSGSYTVSCRKCAGSGWHRF
jgi:DnaJ-class molecular chaperone